MTQSPSDSWLPVATIAVAGNPKGQPRPWACIRGKHASVYNPASADGWRHEIVLAARRVCPSAPLFGAVSIVVTFYFPPPKRKAKEAVETDYFIGKPDIDNALKLILDALTDAGFWADDSIVCDVAARKLKAFGGIKPGVQIEIFEEGS